MAVDISETMLAALQKAIQAENLSVMRLELEQLHKVPDFGNYDSVVCMRVLPHVQDVQSGLTCIKGALRREGNAIFDLWNDRSFMMLARKMLRRPSHVFTNYISVDQMEKLIGTIGFGVEDSWGWGYPRLGHLSLDDIGYRIAPRYAYSVLFNVRQHPERQPHNSRCARKSEVL
jgi:2-polyprenyl-3-methyl-5-hydroxy-6-metoxy-1,4-benzoquinol methylase